MLSPADRELVGIGASVGAGCQSCLEYHLDAGSRAGLDQPMLLRAMEDAECVRRSASGQLSALGRERLGVVPEQPADCCDTSDRTKELVAVGAAVAANSQTNLEKHLAAAQLVGLSSRELDEAVRLARAVQRRSAEILADGVAALLARSRPAEATLASVSADCGPDCGCTDAPVATALPVVEAASASAGCGPDCGCSAGLTESVVGAQLAVAAAAPTGVEACACGCS